MSAAVTGSGPMAAPPPPWLGLALVLLAGAFGAVTLGLVAALSGGTWFGGPPTIAAAGASFEPVRGTGHVRQSAFVLDATDRAGNAILAVQVAPFEARSYARVEWRLERDSAIQPSLAFLWRTREQPERMHVQPLRWVNGRIAPLQLTGVDGWTGNVIGMAIAVRGALPQPLVFQYVALSGVSARSAAQDIARQWTARQPFKASSIAFPFDEERNDHLALPVAVALAQALALAAYLLLARWRRWGFDARVAWAVFLAGWLALDLRWQVNLGRQLVLTGSEFAGLDTEGKHRAAEDHEFYEMLRGMYAALPPPPARVFLLSDNASLRARGAFFLYPRNVNGYYLDGERGRSGVNPDDLRAGDCVLLLLYGGVRYDRDGKALVWPGGRRTPVDELRWKADDIVLVRVK